MGWVNADANDQYRIDSMPGTDDVPAAGALDGLASAPFKGIAAGADKVVQLVNDTAATGVGSNVIGALTGQSPYTVRLAGMEGQDIERNNAAVKVVNDWSATGQDPRVTGTAGRITSGLTEGLTIATAGTALAGPWGAASLLGGAYGHADYKASIAEGIDQNTAMEKAGLTAAFSAAGAFLPMKYGKTLAASMLGGGAANVTFGMAQRGLSSAVLEANGYHDQAQQYRVFDGESMVADAITGSAFGVLGHFSGAHRAMDPADVDAAQAVEVEDHFNNSAPGVPTSPDVANLHVKTLTEAADALAKGDLPDVPVDAAQTLIDGMVPDPAHAAMAEGVAEAAHDVPGYESAAADVPRVELPPEEAPPVKEEPVPAAGEPAKEPDVPMEGIHGDVLEHLVHNYPDLPYTTEDGRETTYRKMADEMQAQRNEADSFSKLHDVAAACALRNGG